MKYFGILQARGAGVRI